MADSPTARSIWKTIPWWTLLIALVAGLFATTYWRRTSMPAEVTIYGGPQDGRYDELAREIASQIRSRYKIRVDVVSSKGSLVNLEALEAGKADFAFYQPRTREVVNPNFKAPDLEPTCFVANLYTEVVVPFASQEHADTIYSKAKDKTWACNDQMSGDYAAARILLGHVGIQEKDLKIEAVPYREMVAQLKRNRLDAGIVASGLHAPILNQLFASPDCYPVEVPYTAALAHKHTAMRETVIPAGFYQTNPPLPATDFHTVGMRAQLLTRRETRTRIVEAVTEIIMDARFQRDNQLVELFAGGIEYAVDGPEFEMHTGAEHIYYPEFKPLLNPDFVEGTEGLRSFIVSMLFATWLVYHWWTRRSVLGNEHRLDRYIHKLLELERRQLDFDGDLEGNDASSLQSILDEVTMLRQEALSEFTAHELNEDSAADCFMHMCHALSDKINAKLTRQTLIQLLRE